MIKKFILFYFLNLIFWSCSNSTKNPIENILASEHQSIKTVVNNLEKHEVQILFTEVKNYQSENPTFKDYSFQADSSNYFYPASSVKFPVAILALEKLNGSKNHTRNTPFKIVDDTIWTTISKDIEQIFAVSDNAAYNRLFEYLGQDAINTKLNNKGLLARISHRVSVTNSDNLATMPVQFSVSSNTLDTLHSIKNKSIRSLQLNKIKKGKGYIENDSLINQPKDFSKKNYLPLISLHDCMKRLIFPNVFSETEQFKITRKDREFLLKSMLQKPRDLGYDIMEYYDSYVKFLVFGDTKSRIPEHIKIYNKVGYAYGTLTDCAYIINEKTNKAYIITATLLVNSNGIFNDDAYEYETDGIPFLAQLGRQLIGF